MSKRIWIRMSAFIGFVTLAGLSACAHTTPQPVEDPLMVLRQPQKPDAPTVVQAMYVRAPLR